MFHQMFFDAIQIHFHHIHDAEYSHSNAVVNNLNVV